MRVGVPVGLQPFLFGKKEIHFTLKSGDRRAAKRKVRELAPRLHHVFSILEEACDMTITNKQINQIIRDYVQGKLRLSEG
jgi:hypothetical protein